MGPSGLRLLRPHEEAPDIFSIDYEALWARGIRGLIFDLDNTLCLWRRGPPDRRTASLLQALRDRGFGLCVLSNGRLSLRPGVLEFFRELGIAVIWPARKPLPGGFRRALALLGLSPRETAVIGDQLLTDVLGGRLLGFYTILVEPLAPEEHPFTRLFSRGLERLLGRRLRR